MNHHERKTIRANAAKDLLAGMSMNELCEKYERSMSWIAKVRYEFGIPRRTRQGWGPLNIMAAIAAGFSGTDIARAAGVTKQYVSEVKRTYAENYRRFSEAFPDINAVYHGEELSHENDSRGTGYDHANPAG